MNRRRYLQTAAAAVGLGVVGGRAAASEVVEPTTPLAELHEQREERGQYLTVLMTDAVGCSSYLDQRREQAERLAKELAIDGNHWSFVLDDAHRIARMNIVYPVGVARSMVTFDVRPLANIPTHVAEMADVWLCMDSATEGVARFIERNDFDGPLYFRRAQRLSFGGDVGGE